MTTGNLDVIKYLSDGTTDFVSQGVDAPTAFTDWTTAQTSADAVAGTIVRLIIKAPDDNLAGDWEFKRGVTFPRQSNPDKFYAARPDAVLEEEADPGTPTDPTTDPSQDPPASTDSSSPSGAV